MLVEKDLAYLIFVLVYLLSTDLHLSHLSYRCFYCNYYKFITLFSDMQCSLGLYLGDCTHAARTLMDLNLLGCQLIPTQQFLLMVYQVFTHFF